MIKNWTMQCIIGVLKFIKYLFEFLFIPSKRRSYLALIRDQERKLHLGLRKRNITFYLIRCTSQVEGHFSTVNRFLGHLKEADEKGYVPVVDLKHYYSKLWQNVEKKGKENAWEYFFLQPAAYDLNDVKGSRNVILSPGYVPKDFPRVDQEITREAIKGWNSLYQKYIFLNPEAEVVYLCMMKEMGIKEKRVIGVSVRREIEYSKDVEGQFQGYSIPPDMEDIICNIDSNLIRWNCDYIFFVSDDQEMIEVFKDYYKEKILISKRKRTRYYNDGKPVDHSYFTRKDVHNLQTSKEFGFGYIAEIYALAQCTSFMGTKNSGNITALIINNGNYENYLFY